MSRSVLTRAALYAALAVAALVFLVPSFVRPAPAFWPWRQPIRLGLDLQGGTHLLYGVDIDQAVDNTVDQTLEDLMRLSLRARGVTSLPFVWFWPDGAPSCAIVTHDVETEVGRDRCSWLMDLDDSYGIKKQTVLDRLAAFFDRYYALG